MLLSLENRTHSIQQLKQMVGPYISLLWKQKLEVAVLPP